MVEEIRTERLLLRRATADDIAPMHRILSNAEAMRYWSSLPHTEIGQTEAWMASTIDPSVQGGDEFIVMLNGEVIGKMGCWKPPEIGFIFDPACWGRGYASEALGAFIDYRRNAGGEEITADVDPRNAAAIALLAKAGFEEAGRAKRTWQLGGEWCDSIYLKLDLKRA